MRSQARSAFTIAVGALFLGACGGGQPRSANTEADAKPPQALAPVAVAEPAAPSPPPRTTGPSGAEPLEVRVKFRADVADGSHPTEFQTSRRVGHYSTRNGKVGFVLDRTTDPPKIQMDGDPYVLVLSPRQASKGWLEYVATNIWIRVDEETGSILSFSGPGMKDASFVVRDADARVLSAPR
jgi:hypothetical protein